MTLTFRHKRIKDKFRLVKLELKMNDESAHNYWIFIDNSNLFIEGQKFYATMNNWHVRTDPRFRIDFVKLINCIVSDPKRVKDVYLFGSEPPSLDTLWMRLKKRGFNVITFKRDWLNREKEVDVSLAVEATECACDESAIGMSGTFVFITGDRDLAPAIKKVIKRDFRVLVVSYKSVLSNSICSIDGVGMLLH